MSFILPLWWKLHRVVYQTGPPHFQCWEAKRFAVSQNYWSVKFLVWKCLWLAHSYSLVGTEKANGQMNSLSSGLLGGLWQSWSDPYNWWHRICWEGCYSRGKTKQKGQKRKNKQNFTNDIEFAKRGVTPEVTQNKKGKKEKHNKTIDPVGFAVTLSLFEESVIG